MRNPGIRNSVEVEAAKQHDVPGRPRAGEREPLPIRRPLEVVDTLAIFREVRQLIGSAAVERLHPDVGADGIRQTSSVPRPLQRERPSCRLGNAIASSSARAALASVSVLTYARFERQPPPQAGFLSNQSGVQSAWIISLDGGQPRQLANVFAFQPDAMASLCDIPRCASRVLSTSAAHEQEERHGQPT